MSHRRCVKCRVKFKKTHLVHCNNCNAYFDRACAKKLCQEAGTWAVPPNKYEEWSCTECQSQPAQSCCDVCGRALGRPGPVACGRCRRRACRACAGRRQLLARQPVLVPWLCVYCTDSPKDVPASWHSDKNFAASYSQFPALWKADATESEVRVAQEALARAVACGGEPRPRYVQLRCRQFARNYRALLRRLACRHRNPEDILQHAPFWLRETEQRLNWLPSIIESIWWPDDPEEILVELAHQMRRPEGHRHKWAHHVVQTMAARLVCPAPSLKDIWSQLVRVALVKLQQLALLGDVGRALVAAARLRDHEWLAADAALLQSDCRAEWLVGYLNSQVWLLHLLLRLVQQYRLEECDARELRARWLSAYKQYTRSGRMSSVLVLQRRWWELKLETHSAVRRRARGDRKRPLLPHHVLVARRYPHVVTKPVPSWGELRRNKLIVDVTEAQVRAFKDYVTPLPVAADDLMLQETKILNASGETNVQDNDNNKTQQVVDQLRRDVEELKNFDQMQNLSLTPLIKEYEDHLFQMAGDKANDEVMDCLTTLEEINPKISSTRIIYESDTEVEEETEKKSEIVADSKCQIVKSENSETCELNDDSQVTFKLSSNIAICYSALGAADDVNDDTKPNTNETSVDDAIDPKLKMVPIVPLVRLQTQDAGSIRPQDDRTPNQDATVVSQEDLGCEVPKEDAAEKNRNLKRSEKPKKKTGSNRPQDAEIACQDTIKKNLIDKVPDETVSKNNTEECSVGSDKPYVGKGLKRPWGYKGPLSGRVEDLSWLCTSVSVTLEKLPEEVMHNVKANAATRRVWLPDREQVRRDNKRMLVAQVAPLQNSAAAETVSPKRQSRTISFESSASSESSTSSLVDYGILTQPPDPEDSDDQITEAELQTVLDDAKAAAAPAKQHCCLARRHRAYNDARRRHAARTGRGDTYADHDIHGVRHGKPPYECACCCCHLLLPATPQSLAVLQRALARSLDALLKRRGETPLDNSDQTKRALDADVSSDEERLVIDVARPERRRQKKKKLTNSNADRNNKIDISKYETQTPKKTPKTNKTNNDSDEERQKKEDYNEWMRQKNSHRRFFQPPGTSEKTIASLSKVKDKSTKNSSTIIRPDMQDHTYANQATNETAPMETAISGIQNSVANVAPLIIANEDQNQPCDPQKKSNFEGRGSYAACTVTSMSTQKQATVNPTKEYINTRSAPNLIPISKIPQTTLQTMFKDSAGNATSKQSGNIAPEIQGAPVHEPTLSAASRQLHPTPVQLPNVFVNQPIVLPQKSIDTIDKNPTTSYFMIYQDPAANKTDVSSPSVAIVPVTITIQPQQPTEQVPPNTEITQAPKEKKSIFQENFRQKMVQNLSLLSGGEIIDNYQNEVEISNEVSDPLHDSEVTSPRIFDELPEAPEIKTSCVGTRLSFPTMTSSLPTTTPTLTTIAPSLTKIGPEYPKVAPCLPTTSPSMTISPFLPKTSPTLSTLPIFPKIAPRLSTVAPTLPTLAPGLPTMPSSSPITDFPNIASSLPITVHSLPPVSTGLTMVPTSHYLSTASLSVPYDTNVSSEMQTSANLDNDEDDDCIITSPPVPRKIIITPESSKARNRRHSVAQFKSIESLCRAGPEHISRLMPGWQTAPFALLRANGQLRLWALPSGELVLTDTAVACRNIRYFVINSKIYNRMVPVHFDSPAVGPAGPAAGPQPAARIKVRSFAKMPADDAPAAAATERNLDDMLSAENKLYKRLAHDPPIYGRVLTALTDVISARLLAANGYSLHVYSPWSDSLQAVRADCGSLELYCENTLAAQHIADNFNSCCLSPTEKQWRVVRVSNT